MAEIKFNFYNTYNQYYRNINKLNKLNILVHPYYESIYTTSYFMETISRIYKITLTLYVLYLLRVTQRVDYKVYKSLKKINRKKIFVKTIIKYKNFAYR